MHFLTCNPLFLTCAQVPRATATIHRRNCLCNAMTHTRVRGAWWLLVLNAHNKKPSPTARVSPTAEIECEPISSEFGQFILCVCIYIRRPVSRSLGWRTARGADSRKFASSYYRTKKFTVPFESLSRPPNNRRRRRADGDLSLSFSRSLSAKNDASPGHLPKFAERITETRNARKKNPIWAFTGNLKLFAPLCGQPLKI